MENRIIRFADHFVNFLIILCFLPLLLFGIYAVSSIISAAAALVATVCTFIDYRIAFIVLGLGIALNTHYVSVTIKAAGQADENKLGYVVVVAQYVALFVVAFLLYKIFGEDFTTAMGSMSSFGL